MQYLAAAAMLGIYLYNLPLQIAFIWRAHAFRSAVSVFEWRFALRSARRKLGKPKKKKKANGMKYLKIILRILKYVCVERVSARLLIGTGDAARTALVCGAARALGNVLRAGAKGGKVDIRPEFSGKCMEGEAFIVISVRLGDAVMSALNFRN